MSNTRTAPSFSSAACSVAWILGADALPEHVDPDSIAVRWADEVRTYGDLRRRSLALARSLREDFGLERGDRVGAHFFNRGETFELYFACAYAGLTLVPVNFRMTPYEIDLVLSDSGARVVFTQAELSERARKALEGRHDVRVVTLEDDASGAEFEALCSGEPITAPFEHTDPHLILYTSGTTGRPKGVMLAHQNILWFAFQQVAFYPAMDTSTVTLLIGPMYNTAAINEQSIPTFLAGGTVAIHPSRGWTPQRSSELVDRWGVTHAIIYPSMMEPFLEADRQERIGLETLRFIITGGENCPPALIKRWRDRWSHVSVSVAYGLTEGGVITLCTDEELDRHVGSVGRAAGGQIFKVVHPDGSPVEVGETGEVWTAGPAVISGYWQAPELSAAAVKDGWLNTGDLGRQDADGYLFIEGRTRDLIISKGQNIYPAEIENVIVQHDGVLEVSVIGVPDEEYGEAVCAVVVPKEGRDLTGDEIVEFVRERLSSYKKPRQVAFIDELPRNPSNKVMKDALAERVKNGMVMS